MKRLSGLLIIIALFAGCAKNSPDIANPAFAPDISAVPDRFDQKVLLERFTMASCGQCPIADFYADSLSELWPERFYDVAIHVNDLLEAPENMTVGGTNILDSMFNVFSIYPGGMINRRNFTTADFSADNWISLTQSKMGQIPSCGLALEAKEIKANNHLRLVVHAGFSQALGGDYRLHGYIVQSSITSSDSLLDQMNDFSIEGSTPDSTLSFYDLNDTIHLYKHTDVLTRVININGSLGDQIPQTLMVPHSEYVKVYDVDLTGVNRSNSYIIFFIDKYGDTPNAHWIENVQRVKIGESKDWN
ncbi:MAG: hypothetical protein IPP51_06465 [Bacteroidetes bacterium]|nr:hypothetical protein [Bacteroidota bacterium]